VEPDVVKAVEAAVDEVREGGVVLVTGSLSTAAPVLRWLREA
jgi:folylpolyglutamate synthase/dihydropteroate synthase